MPKKQPVKKAASKKRAERDITQEICNFIEPEELKIKEFRWTENQKRAIELMLDPAVKILFLSGPAGSAKSLVAVYSALQLLKDKKMNEVNYLRSIVESASNKIGFLPGDVEQKTEVYFAPMEEKLDELIPQAQIKSLLAEQKLKAGPINYLRGRTLTNFVIIDEAQCLDFKEMTTVITRLKEGSKAVFCGDFSQIDSKSSGFAAFTNLFDNQESRDHGIHVMGFDESDIKRSKILGSFVRKSNQSATS